jgi:hypothetical protein
VRAVRIFADGDIQLPIRAEVQRAAIMIRGAAEVIQPQDERLAAGDRGVTFGREPAHAVVPRGRADGVINVNEAVRAEVRIERDAEQAALAHGIDADRDERCRQQDTVLDDAKLTILLADEDPAIRREGHGCRAGDPARDKRLGEPRGN